jgi:hypothetical protein
MSLLSRLESKFGRFAIPNLTLILIFGQVLLYVAQQLGAGQAGAGVLDGIRFYPGKVLEGEYWRIVTFLFDPPATNLIFAFFFWYLFYLMGTTLEVDWGVFRYNLFLAVGYLASVALAFGLYLTVEGADLPASSGFLYGTVFLAFARLYPDFVMYIFFILPVKIRWLALLQWIGYTLGFVLGPPMVKAMVFASVANYLLFFGRDIWQDMRQGHRRMKFQAKALRSPQRMVHKCRVCGLTSDTSPHTQFRYCSKCDDDCCYCPEHLQNHQHVVRAAAAKEK